MRRWYFPLIGTGALSALLVLAACSPGAPAAAPTQPAAAPTQAAAAPTQAAAAPTTAPAATKPAAQPTQAAAAATATQPAAAAAGATATPAAAAAAAGPQTKLTFIGVQDPDQQASLQAVLAEYQKQHPEIDVDFELLPFEDLFPKIQADAAAHTPTDIVLADGPNVWSFAYNGIISPMDDYFDKAYIDANFSPTSLKTSYYRDKFMAPPQMESCSLMWFNKDMTDKAGIQVPQDLASSWTTDQALDAWQKTNNPPQVYGVRWGQGSGPGQDYEAGILRREAGTKDSKAYKGLADDSLTITGYFDDPTAVKGHQFFHDLYQNYKVSAVEGIPNAWWDQRAAFYISPDNAIGTYNRLGATFKYGVTGIPYFPGGTQLCHTDSWHYALGANSQHKAQAADFIKFLSGPVGSKIFYDKFGQLPANLQVLNTLPDYQSNPRKLVADQFKAAGQPRIVTVGFTEYNGLMIEFVGNLVAGTDIDVQQLATALAKRSDSLTAKYKDWQTKPLPQ
jgi:ABC-type glycerol-3-phosphate transport system substrate-binding protein